MRRLQTPVRFDVFVDANRDMRWSWIGDLYHSNILNRGWLREEPDVYLYGETPGFTLRYNPERYSTTCCQCDKGTYQLPNVNEVYEFPGLDVPGIPLLLISAAILYWRRTARHNI